MKGLLILLLIIFLLICGIDALLGGDVDSAIIFLFLPASIILSGLSMLAFKLYINLRAKKELALDTMHKIPYSVDYEYGEKWEKEFQKVIAKAIDSTSDATQLSDLQHCQIVTKEMNKNSGTYTKDSPFNKVNKAFRLTGCHLTITDSQGNTISQIV